MPTEKKKLSLMVELFTSPPLKRISFSAPSLIQQSGANFPGKGRVVRRSYSVNTINKEFP